MLISHCHVKIILIMF